MMEQQPRRKSWVVGPMIALALLCGVVIGKGWERTGHASETYEELKTFSEVLNQVQKHYVDETKPKDLIQGAIRGMLSTLDPHSMLLDPTKCIRCGLCAERCPARTITMEAFEVFDQIPENLHEEVLHP